jgi:hypothetical protein
MSEDYLKGKGKRIAPDYHVAITDMIYSGENSLSVSLCDMIIAALQRWKEYG